MLSKEWEDRSQKAMLRVPIQELIGRYQQLSSSGERYFKGVEHDSLIVDSHGFYYWNSKGEQGNHYTWLKNYEPTLTSFFQRVEFLEKFDVTTVVTFVEGQKEEKKTETVHPTMQLVNGYHGLLLKTPKALAWWNSRGIYRTQIDKWKLGYKLNHWGRGSSGAIPYIEDGEVKTIRHRIWVPGLDEKDKPMPKYVPEMKGSGAWMFNADILDEKPESIILLEGEIKLMVGHDFDEFGVALAGVNILPVRYHEKLCAIKTIYFCPDIGLNVSPYELSWIKYIAPHTDLRIVRLPDKFDDMLLSGKNGWKTWQAAKRNAKSVTQRDLEAVLNKKQNRA